MSTFDIRTQIPNPTPQAPPGFTDLVGRLHVAWIILIVVGIPLALYGLVIARDRVQYEGNLGDPVALAAMGSFAVVLGVLLLVYGT